MTEFLNVLKIIGYVLLGFAVYQVILRLIRRNWHFPAPAFLIFFLNSPLRGVMQNPEQVIQRSAIGTGKRVLEIGCGGGFFLPHAAHAVGERGKVYGLDISAVMLAHCRHFLAKYPREVQDRVELVQKSAYELPFEDGSLDVVYFICVLMEIPDPQRCLMEVKRALKPGGIVAVSEFLTDPDYPGRRATIRCGERAGLELEAVKGNFWTYTVRFRKV
jgi:ubiquinone/menaquinone biosynthesis C-methylase UbiE